MKPGFVERQKSATLAFEQFFVEQFWMLDHGLAGLNRHGTVEVHVKRCYQFTVEHDRKVIKHLLDTPHSELEREFFSVPRQLALPVLQIQSPFRSTAYDFDRRRWTR